jgi:hypothetical protein
VEPRTLDEYVRALANTLGLTDWGLSIEWHDLPADTTARVVMAYGRRFATIILGEEYLNSSPADRRETLVHELLHLHFAQADELVNDTLPDLLGRPSFSAFEAAHNLVMERAIDAVAVAIGDMGTIPFPPEEG